MMEHKSAAIAVPPIPTMPAGLQEWFKAFYELVIILRKECPWDRKQTHESISHLLVEEAYETLDAIAQGDDKEFSKELGDLLLHVVMHGVMAEQRGAFTMQDVIQRVFEKLVHRHPHVFGESKADNEQEVKQRWEEMKMKEGRSSVLEGVPAAMPALLRAQRIQEKAAGVGFEWSDKKEMWKKVDEELAELHEAMSQDNPQKTKQEFGDVFFALVNAARFEGIVAEESVQLTNSKFTRRFAFIEQKAAEHGKNLRDMTLGEMDEWWNEAKKME
ncbi:MAG: nucleoside triphosphate pyrophosphohydrolase [Candidatus Kapaibacterium sp.]